MAFTAINRDQGHMATGSGRGGGGGGGKKPSRGTPSKNTGISQRERVLEEIRQRIKDLTTLRFQMDAKGKIEVNINDMTRPWLEGLISSYSEGRNAGLSASAMYKGILKNPPATQWMDKLCGGDDTYELTSAPRLATPDTLGAPSEVPSLNIAGGNNYIPTIIASGVRGLEINSIACDSCVQRGNYFFGGCYTVEGLFKGACLECACDNHYERCNFSSHEPTQRNTRNRADYDAQVAQNLKESNTSHAPEDPLAVAHRDRPMLPMYDSSGRPLFRPIQFNTPSPLSSPAGNAFPHDNRYPIDFGRSLPAMGVGSRHGMAVINFNYPSGASRDQQRAYVQAALRNALENFTEVWDASDAFNPGNIRFRSPDEDADPDVEMN